MQIEQKGVLRRPKTPYNKPRARNISLVVSNEKIKVQQNPEIQQYN